MSPSCDLELPTGALERVINRNLGVTGEMPDNRIYETSSAQERFIK